MTIKDIHGHAMSAADANAAEHYEAACALLRCYLNDPLAEAQAALAQAPDMTMAHVLVAYLNLLGTEPGGRPVAREALTAAEAVPPPSARLCTWLLLAHWPMANGSGPAACWRT